MAPVDKVTIWHEDQRVLPEVIPSLFRPLRPDSGRDCFRNAGTKDGSISVRNGESC